LAFLIFNDLAFFEMSNGKIWLFYCFNLAIPHQMAHCLQQAEEAWLDAGFVTIN
jgi:hypothetical protein